MCSAISFSGVPPYSLPAAQSVSVRAAGDSVEFTFKCILPGKGPNPQAVSISIAMIPSVANGLIANLAEACRMARASEG